MKGPGILVALVALCLVGSSAEGRWTSSTSKWKRAIAPKRPSVVVDQAAVVSPDGRHLATVDRRGRLRIDGRPVGCGNERLYGRPVWRRDGKALALLQRAPRGLKLCVVLTDALDNLPLTHWLPHQHRESLKSVFWVGHKRIGIGQRAPVPRVVFSWSDDLF